MENLRLETGQNVFVRDKLASVGERMLAYLIDLAVITAYILMVYYATQNVYYTDRTIMILVALIPVYFYSLLNEIFTSGQSPGKKAMRIKVVKVDGTQATLEMYFYRWIFRIVDILLFSGSVAVIFISSNGKQRIGDIIAGTTVVKLKSKVSLSNTMYVELPDNYETKYGNIDILSEDDMRVVNEVLQIFRRNISSQKSIEYIIKTASQISKKIDAEYSESPAEFLFTVLKDYNSIHKAG